MFALQRAMIAIPIGTEIIPSGVQMVFSFEGTG